MNSQAQTEASHAAEATRKRTAARKLIERYYFQLTDGCGNQSCANENCASCQKAPKLEPDEAAARAIQLFKSKAKLCVPPCPPLNNFPRNVPNGANHFELPSTLAQADVRLCRKAKRNGSSKMDTNIEDGDDSALSKSSIDPQTSVSVSHSSQNTPSPVSSCSEGARESSHQSVLSLDESSLLEIIEKCQTDNNFSLLIRTLGHVFSKEESLKLSFKRDLTKENISKEDIRAMEVDEDKDKDSSSEDACMEETDVKPGVVTVDISSVRRAFSALFKIPEYPFQRALINALIILSENLEFDLKYGQKQNIDPSLLNIFVIVMEIPMMQCPEYLEKALPAFCKAASYLPVRSQAVLARTWSTYQPDRLREMLNVLHQFISLKVIQGGFTREYCINDEDTIIAATKLMKIIYYASLLGGEVEDTELTDEDNELVEEDENLRELLGASAGSEPKENSRLKQDPLSVELNIKAIDCRKPLLYFDEFYNEPLSEQLEMDRDFAYYKADGGNTGKFSFMNYSFILTPAVKSMGLYYDNRIRMYSERRMSVLQSIVHGAPPNPYLKLRVRRDHLIDDALVGLEMVAMESPTNFKKQLVVEFDGEQGIDEGGVSKEFFQLVVEEIFNPDFAMFTLNPETQSYWFNPTSFENDAQFTLIGIILGLAIYNNVILDVHFPMVVYRKLMGKKGTFYDLKDWNPSLWKGLNDLLSYTGDDVENVFMQSFRITYTDVFGTVLVHNLKESDELLVNQDNKEEFVRLYSDFLLNKSIAKQFQAFKKGFQMVTEDSPLRILFRPEEIELLVCGNKNFDFNALERATEYDGGYLSDSDVIKWFWELVHDFTLEQKRKLLQFTTGSDRVPVGGLSKLKLVIARNGGDSDRLPTAHTCFNVLLLPEYETKEKLEDRLLKAINYSKGFGML
ncbi:ubiquitin-protein ligase E3A [Parasteatoda tepidariorum]|uniref:ubiquitin-protein ligase E3A n=1 Tax=Parasteatoda tepidariorum TaxID=114398 RepID=UPI000A2C0165|nr:ubiquitin-protein ligase E3A [Parasteatoda tepidariorum]